MLKYRRKMLTIMVVTTVLGIPAFIINLFDAPGSFHSIIIRYWAQLLLWLNGIKVEVEKPENLQAANPAVIIINHESALDIAMVLAALPVPVRFMAKKELFAMPIFGWELRLGGHIAIDRVQRKRALTAIEKYSPAIVREKQNIAVSPEGTRTKDGKIGPFKKGAFHLAERFDIPLIPVTILGAADLVPVRKRAILPGTARLMIDPPVKTTDFADLDACIEAVRNRMIEHKERYEVEKLSS